MTRGTLGGAHKSTKRKIIRSTATGTFWNSDSLYHDQFMEQIKTPLNLLIFLDVIQETKRVHKQKCADLAHELIKIIRDFNFFELTIVSIRRLKS